MLLAENTQLELLDFHSSTVGATITEIANSIRCRTMPLSALHLAENAITVPLAVDLVAALRQGAPQLSDLDLSGNPLCGVEEGGKDEYTTEVLETLCAWMADGASLLSLSLVDVALCGLARDGNGSYQSQGIAVLNETLSSGQASLRSLNVSGCKVSAGHLPPITHQQPITSQLSSTTRPLPPQLTPVACPLPPAACRLPPAACPPLPVPCPWSLPLASGPGLWTWPLTPPFDS